MNSIAGLTVVPASVWWPLAVAAALPVVFGALAVAGWPSHALATRLAVRTAALLSLGCALLVSFATITVFDSGLDALGERPPEGLAQVGDEVSHALQGVDEPLDRLLPRLVLAQSADPRVSFAAIVKRECTSTCLIAATPSLGDTADARVRDLLGVLRTIPPGVTRRPTTLDGAASMLMLRVARPPRGAAPVVVVFGLDASPVATRAARLAWQMIGVSILLLLITTVVARQGYAISVTDRVRGLIDLLVERRGDGDAWSATPTSNAAPGRHDELHRLAERIDGWIERSLADHRRRDAKLHTFESQLTHAQKMEAIGLLSDGIAHDFNNLLTVIRANAQLLDGKDMLSERRAIDAAAARGATLVKKLRSFSRVDVLAPRAVPLADLLGGITDVLRRVLPETMSLELHSVMPRVAAVADPAAFEQMLLNLVVNARDAMTAGGRVEISVAQRRADLGSVGGFELPPGDDYVTVAVRDTGSGMSPDVLHRAFEPFFTTKPPESGLGLGLAIVHGIMQQHRGAVEIESSPGAGTTVTLWFPATEIGDAVVVAEPTPFGATAVVPQSATGRGRILLVEDEEGVRLATERALLRLGYDVLSAEHGAAAMAILNATGDPVHLIVSDMMMPVMGGLELWRAVREHEWDTPILFVSGYSTESIAQATRGDRAAFTLSKPWTVSELGRAVRSAIESQRVAA